MRWECKRACRTCAATSLCRTGARHRTAARIDSFEGTPGPSNKFVRFFAACFMVCWIKIEGFGRFGQEISLFGAVRSASEG
jgi:hypothetical protein